MRVESVNLWNMLTLSWLGCGHHGSDPVVKSCQFSRKVRWRLADVVAVRMAVCKGTRGVLCTCRGCAGRAAVGVCSLMMEPGTLSGWGHLEVAV